MRRSKSKVIYGLIVTVFGIALVAIVLGNTTGFANGTTGTYLLILAALIIFFGGAIFFGWLNERSSLQQRIATGREIIRTSKLELRKLKQNYDEINQYS